MAPRRPTANPETARPPDTSGFRRAFLAPAFWPTWIALAALFLYTRLPRRLRNRISGRIGEWVYRFYDKRRRFAEVNVGWCYPDMGQDSQQRLVRAHFRAYMQILLDLPTLWWGRRIHLERLIKVREREHIDQALARGRRVILLTCHCAALDFGVIGLNFYYPITGLANRFDNPLVDWLVTRARSRFGIRVVERAEGMRALVRDVRNGWLKYYIPDEDLGLDHAIFAPFFGVPKATIALLPRLVQACGADVIPCYSYYSPEEGRYEIRVFPALENYPSRDLQQDVTTMNQCFEQLIALRPEQYMWTLRLFKTRPSGEESPYRRQ